MSVNKRLILFCMSLLAISGCGSIQPITTMTRNAPNATIHHASTVLIVKPVLKFENIHDESAVSADQYNGVEIEQAVLNAAKKSIATRNIAVSEQPVPGGWQTTEFGAHVAQLSRGKVSAENKAVLSEVALTNPGAVVLVNYVDVKVGSEGSWNPNSGAITSSNSKSVFQAALIESKSGKVLWRDQVLLRDVPKSDNAQLVETLELLYAKFPQRED